MIQDSRKKNIRSKKVKGLDTIHLPRPYHYDQNPQSSQSSQRKIKIVHTMSDVGKSPVSNVLEGTERGFTPVNPGRKINITEEKPVAASKSKAKAESTVQEGKSDKAKAKAEKVWSAMNDSKAEEKKTAKAINADKAEDKGVTKAKQDTKTKAAPKALPPLKPKPKANPFIMTEAKTASSKSSKAKPKPQVKAPSPESGDESESEGPATKVGSSADLQIKDITNRNKTTVARLNQALSDRGLPIGGNRHDVTARFFLYELGLDTTGGNKEMQQYCNLLLQTGMSRLKESLVDLGLPSVGTNKPALVERILMHSYPNRESDEEDEENSSSEEESESDREGPETSATDSTFPDNVANGKKRARADWDDSEDEEAKSKRQKVDASDDESEEPKVKKPSVHGKTKLNPATNEVSSKPHEMGGVSKAIIPRDDKKKRRRPAEEEEDNAAPKQKEDKGASKQQKQAKSDGNPEVQQAKKLKLTVKPKKDKDHISAAEIGRAVRAKPNPSTIKPKSKKKSKDEDQNHFLFNEVWNSRNLFENVSVPSDVLTAALKVLLGNANIKDINVVHDFRHPLPLFKLYREGKHKPNTKKCPRSFIAAQEFYQEREEELTMEIREREIKEDEEKAKEKAKENGEVDSEMSDDGEDDEGFDDEEAEDDQRDQEMSDAGEEGQEVDDLMMAPPVNEASNGAGPATDSKEGDVAKVYQQAEIAAHNEDVQDEQDEFDDLRGKSLHAWEDSYLASIPEGTTLESYYENLWEPASDEEGSKEKKLQMRKEEIALMKMAKVEAGSEEFKKVRLSHGGKW